MHNLLGYGSVLNINGDVQMDASIMDGKNLNAGCATLVEDILHPITLARAVMERSNHTFIGGDGVMQFANKQNITILKPSGQLVTQAAREALERFKKDNNVGQVSELGASRSRKPRESKDYGEVGTVGAVAIDQYGNVAAATSTGGMTGKSVGRIGDSPILGAGTYADNLSGAVSVTGHGETILKFNVAGKILQRMEYFKESASDATEKVLEEMTNRLEETAGAITVGANGDIGHYWTSEKMAWAYQRGNKIHYGIKKGEDFVEDA